MLIASPWVWGPPAAVAGVLARLYAIEGRRRVLPPSPPSRPGLWFYAHRAHRLLPFQHFFFRITPTDGHWPKLFPRIFERRDAAGRPYCTLGAGPRDGYLALEFNRKFDLEDPITFEEAVVFRDADEEAAVIEAVLKAALCYDQSLRFAAWSRVTGNGYNCNSMVRELADRAGIPTPAYAWKFMLCPGFGRGLPGRVFHVGDILL